MSESVLMDTYRARKNLPHVTIQDFFEQVSNQDPCAIAVWQEYIEYLSIGLYNIVSMYDPHYVVIGGTIANYPHILLPPLMRRVFGDSSFYIKNDTYILTSQLEKDSSVLGAALIPVELLFSFQ